jgi:hypothetical protein
MSPILGPSKLGATRAYEIQRVYNFEIRIYGVAGADMETLTYACEKAPQINESNSPIDVPYGNRAVKVAGKAKFENGGSLVVRDFIQSDTSGIVVKWRKKVYDVTNDAVGFAADYKKQARIMEFAPDGSIPRTWILDGVWPSDVKYIEHSMTSGDLGTIEITLAYDKARREF